MNEDKWKMYNPQTNDSRKFKLTRALQKLCKLLHKKNVTLILEKTRNWELQHNTNGNPA